MAQCITVNGDGTLTAVADPCTGHVLLTLDEYSAIEASPLNLSAADGLALSVAIGAVWAAAFAIRAIVKALNVDGDYSSEV